ncbi:MAG TPA: sigma-70 family RNA polymerase sigma factor [Gemmataceae bacterium]|nr:sigma-70 family RNA polymerase sigma factor [Gemmataceae bacterium]
MDATELLETLRAARTDDPAAREALFRMLHEYLEAQASRYANLVRPDHSLRDLVQETELRLLERLGQFQGAADAGANRAEFRDWAGTALFHAACNIYRARTARSRRPHRPPLPLGGADGRARPEPPADGPSPSSAARSAEAAGLVASAIDDLPEGQRDIVRLHYFEGLSLHEIAARRGVSYDAVRGPFREAKKRLQRALGLLQ